MRSRSTTLLCACGLICSGGTASRSGAPPPIPVSASPQPALPGKALALAEEGISAHSEGRLADAITGLEAVLEVVPDHAPTLVNLGLVWETTELPLQAMECYSKAVNADPTTAAAYMHMGVLLHEQLGEHEMGEEALRTAVSLAPDDADGWARLGRLLEDQRALEASHAALAEAARLAPTSADHLRNLATVQRSTGRFEEAVTSLHAAAAAVATTAERAASMDAAALERALSSSCRLRAIGQFQEAAESLRQVGADAMGGADGDRSDARALDQALAYAPPSLIQSHRADAMPAESGGASDPAVGASRVPSSVAGDTSLEGGGGRIVESAKRDALPLAAPEEWIIPLSRIHCTRVASYALPSLPAMRRVCVQ